jgi:hypothetical protein
MDMTSEPQEVCGAATLGHQHVKSSQNTLPMANDAGIHQAEKIKKPLRGYLCPLTTGGLIRVRLIPRPKKGPGTPGVQSCGAKRPF